MCTINLGSGLLETVYQKIYIYELEENGLNVKPELAIPVSYDGKESDLNFRVDILGDLKRVVNSISFSQI